MDSVRRVGQRIVDLFAHPAGMAARPMARILNLVNAAANRRVADLLELGGEQLGQIEGLRVFEISESMR